MVRLEKLMFTVHCVTLCIVLTHLLLVSAQMQTSRNRASSINPLNMNPVPPMSELTNDSSTITEPYGASTVTVPTTTTTEPTNTESTTTPTNTTLSDCSGKTVQDLMVLDAGTESLVLQWRDPTDCGPFSITSYEISLIPESDRSKSITLPVPATCVNTTDYYRRILLNSSTCGNPSLDAKLRSCTSYALTVNGSLSGGSTTISAFTLPSAEEGHVLNLKFDEVNATSFKFSWGPPTCNYNIVAYNVTLKDPEGQEVTAQETISGSQFVIDGDFGGIKIDPCIRYQVRMAPIFLNSTPGNAGEFITATTRNQNISFLNINHTSTDRTVVLTWILQAPESCQGKISTYNLTYSIDNMDSSLTVNASCSSSGSCSYTITDLLPCSLYSVRLVPAEEPFDGLPSGNFGSVFTQPGDDARISNLTIVPGSSWVYFRFRPPVCSKKNQVDFYRFVPFNATLNRFSGDYKNTQTSCLEKDGDFLWYNVSKSSSDCGQNYKIEPCTIYRKFRIRVFYKGEFESQAKNVSHLDYQRLTTLPDLGESLRGKVKAKGPDWFEVSWEPPSCATQLQSFLVTVRGKNQDTPEFYELPVTEDVRLKQEFTLRVSSGGFSYFSRTGRNRLEILPSSQYMLSIESKYNTTDQTGKPLIMEVHTDHSDIGVFQLKTVGEREVSFSVEMNTDREYLKLTDVQTRSYAKPWIILMCTSQKRKLYVCNYTVKEFLEKGSWPYNGGERTYISPCRSYQLSIGNYEKRSFLFNTPPGSLGELRGGLIKATVNGITLSLGLHQNCSLQLTRLHLSLFLDGVMILHSDVPADTDCMKHIDNRYEVTIGVESLCEPLRRVGLQGCRKYFASLLPELSSTYNGTRSNISIVTEPQGSSGKVSEITFLDSPKSFDRLQWRVPQCQDSLQLTRYYVYFFLTNPDTWNSRTFSPVCSFSVPGSESMVTGTVQINMKDYCESSLASCSHYEVDIASSFEGLRNNYTESYTFYTPPSEENGKVRNVNITDIKQDSFKLFWENPICRLSIAFFRVAMNDENNFVDVPSNLSVSRYAPLEISNEGVNHKGYSLYNHQRKLPKLKACLSYTVSVTAYYQQDQLGWSENIKFTTANADIEPVRANVSEVTSTSAIVRWEADANPQCVLHYEVVLLDNSLDATKDGNMTFVTEETAYWITGLVPGANYTVRVDLRLKSGNRQREGRGLKLSFMTSFNEKQLPDSARIGGVIAGIVVVILVAVFLLTAFFYKRRRRLGSTVPVTEMSPMEKKPCLLKETEPRRERPILLSQFLEIAAVFSVTETDELKSEYQELKTFSEENLPPKTVASLPENKPKNRYVNILPFDFNRVLLQNGESSEESDYINASFVAGLNGSDEYIAAQAPKEATLFDFWKMIWQQKVRLIVMLTSLHEKGKSKCEQYWPDRRASASYGIVMVKHVHEEELNGFISRQLEVTHGKTKRKITQLHYTNWPDFGCPSNPGELITCVQTMRGRNAALGEVCTPILVHCSAGVGRTGTFIAIDILIQEANTSEKIDVFKTVLKLREYRVQMVQTIDQYAFLYKCMAHYIRTKLQNKERDGLDDGLVEISLA